MSVLRIAARLTVILGLFAPHAYAVDGVREINQACAAGPGCFDGDTPGFPVNIPLYGSYRLTSDLWPAQGGAGIEITGRSVSLDLNGFRVAGGNGYAQGQGCTAPSSGHRGVIAFANASGVVVSNGHVLGMGSDGVQLLGANSRVERVIAELNCGGITVGFASLVSDSVARFNAVHGMKADRSSRVTGSVADQNGGTGIIGVGGDLTVDGCTANASGQGGIQAGPRSLVRGSTASLNVGHGIDIGPFSQVLETIVTSNGGGISSTGGLTGVGLSMMYGNSSFDLAECTAVACNMVGGTRVCP